MSFTAVIIVLMLFDSTLFEKILCLTQISELLLLEFEVFFNKNFLIFAKTGIFFLKKHKLSLKF
jgi:hypothetical protein